MDFEENITMNSHTVLTDDFNATVFAFCLLSKDEVFFTKLSPYFFRGEHFARFKNGVYEYQSSPEKGFLLLSKENAKKWFSLLKTDKLEKLAKQKENVTQNLCVFFNDYFFDIYSS